MKHAVEALLQRVGLEVLADQSPLLKASLSRA